MKMRTLPFKAIKTLAIFTCLSLLIAGCGSSAPDDALIKSCEQLNINLNSLRQEPNLYKVDDPSDKLTTSASITYFLTNIGNETRQRNKDVISDKYRFMANDLETAMYFSGNLDNNVRYKFFAEAIKNTGFKMNLTQSQIASLKGNYEDPSADLLDAEIDRIIGVDLYDEEDNFVGKTGCKLVSDYKYGLNQEDSEKNPYDDELDDTDLLWVQAEDNVEWVYEVVTYTNICQKEGTYLGHKCARNDYVSKGDYSLPAPTRVNPWSRTWSSKELEAIAKTTWCIENGYRNYIYSSDSCTNTISR
jgi:hypothetical protein